MLENSIIKILQSDWTADNEESKKLLKNNYFLKDEKDDGEKFLNNYKRFLIVRNGCYDFSEENEDKCIRDLEPRSFKLIVEKKKIHEIVQNFFKKNVLATKVCFGFDKPIKEGGKIQLTASGTFWAKIKDLSGETDITDRIFIENRIVPRYQNFDEGVDERRFGEFHKNLVHEISDGNELENNEKGAIFGYVMSTRTLLSMLENEDQFGHCTTIDFDFGMDNFIIGQEALGKLLMIKISSSDKPSPVYWLQDTTAVPNDPFTCPPREPCTPGGGTGG